jgi:hypothetical protein
MNFTNNKAVYIDASPARPPPARGHRPNSRPVVPRPPRPTAPPNYPRRGHGLPILQNLIPSVLTANNGNPIENLGSFLANPGSFFANPLPTLASLLPPVLEPLFPGTDGFQRPTPRPNSGTSKQNPPPKPPKGGGKPGHEAQCTTQEINCGFVREAAYQLQNDDDECLKLATSFDTEGKIKFQPIAQDAENVIYGLTTDGLTASAWCNDIGWALRKIYIGCRRGAKCYGGKILCKTQAPEFRRLTKRVGSAYAARNSVFLVTVGPRLDTSLIPNPTAAKPPS